MQNANRMAGSSTAFVQRRDLERSQKKFGTALAPAANSPRWDVQEAYRNLFFVPEGKVSSHAVSCCVCFEESLL